MVRVMTWPGWVRVCLNLICRNLGLGTHLLRDSLSFYSAASL